MFARLLFALPVFTALVVACGSASDDDASDDDGSGDGQASSSSGGDAGNAGNAEAGQAETVSLVDLSYSVASIGGGSSDQGTQVTFTIDNHDEAGRKIEVIDGAKLEYLNVVLDIDVDAQCSSWYPIGKSAPLVLDWRTQGSSPVELDYSCTASTSKSTPPATLPAAEGNVRLTVTGRLEGGEAFTAKGTATKE